MMTIMATMTMMTVNMHDSSSIVLRFKATFGLASEAKEGQKRQWTFKSFRSQLHKTMLCQEPMTLLTMLMAVT